MSTRATIVVKDDEYTCYVYHHLDGYPEGVGRELKQYIPKFLKSVKNGERYMNSVELCTFLQDSNDSFEFENIGIHGDEDYIYHITFHNNGSINLTVDDWIHHTRVIEYSQDYNIYDSELTDTVSLSESKDIDSLTEILSQVISDFLRSEEGKEVLKKAINKYFDK